MGQLVYAIYLNNDVKTTNHCTNAVKQFVQFCQKSILIKSLFIGIIKYITHFPLKKRVLCINCPILLTLLRALIGMAGEKNV